VKTGRYSTIKSQRIRDLIAEFRQDADPLDVLEELHMLRALVRDYLERYDENTEALLRWHASFVDSYLSARTHWLHHVQALTQPITNDLSAFIANLAEQVANIEDIPPELQGILDNAVDELRGLDARNRHTERTFEPAPDPLAFENKPRQVLDIISAGKFISEITRIVERVEKIKNDKLISVALVNAYLESLGAGVTRALEESLNDADRRAKVVAAIEREWSGLALQPSARRAAEYGSN
jgi:hypothetical protein